MVVSGTNGGAFCKDFGSVRSATFAVFIILIVFFPLLTLTGIEGKYFTPMAKTLVFCIIGALLLSSSCHTYFTGCRIFAGNNHGSKL